MWVSVVFSDWLTVGGLPVDRLATPAEDFPCAFSWPGFAPVVGFSDFVIR
jgi:hypothetical protein